MNIHDRVNNLSKISFGISVRSSQSRRHINLRVDGKIIQLFLGLKMNDLIRFSDFVLSRCFEVLTIHRKNLKFF